MNKRKIVSKMRRCQFSDLLLDHQNNNLQNKSPLQKNPKRVDLGKMTVVHSLMVKLACPNPLLECDLCHKPRVEIHLEKNGVIKSTKLT